MNDKQNKRRFFGYFPFDYKAFEQELAQEIAQGWMLETLSRFSVSYRRTENADLVPYIEVFTGTYESDGEKKLAAYKKKRKSRGWQYAGELDFFYVWYLPAGETKPEPDAQAERNLNQRMVWSKELSVLGIAIAILVLGLVAVWKLAYTDLLTFTGVGSVMMFGIFLIPCVVVAALIWREIAAAKRPLLVGQPLPVPEIGRARRRYRLIYGLALAIAVYIALIFILDGIFGYNRYLSLLLPIVAASLAVWGLQRVKSRAARRALTLVTLVVCGGLLFASQSRTSTDLNALVAPQDMSVVLTMDEKPASSAYHETVSPVVPVHYTYTQQGEGKKTALNEYFRIPADFCRRIVLDEVLQTMRGVGEVSEIDPEPWEADRAWCSEDGAVLLLRGSEILYYKATDAEGNALALTLTDIG